MRRLITFWIGFRDGWAQPWDLVWSRNIEHLTTEDYPLPVAMETLDHGINLGQSLRGGHQSQADREGFVPWGLRRRLAACGALLGTSLPLGHSVAAGTINGLTALALVVAIMSVWVICTGGRSSCHGAA